MRVMDTAAREHLRTAMALHAEGDIDGALAEARRAIAISPDFADALSYLGSTLITRKGAFTEGLAALAKAGDAAPDDPTIHYTVGWCCEFVSHALRRRPVAGLDADDLYRQAERQLRRCLELQPDDKIRDDAKDLLATILREDVE